MKDSASAAFLVVAPKKLIEVALPLDEINRWSAKEKSIKQGHPSTLHLWWARRPLAAARAVLFAQLVNDPSWKYSEEEQRKSQVRSAITRKRNELFRLIAELVKWENTTNEEVLAKARAAILDSWRETCEANRDHPQAGTLFNPRKLPRLHDPFAGGGSIPLEAQRLGLDAFATDLNPVAVLINKAMLELPARFAGNHPVGPVPAGEKQTKAKLTENWSGPRGLAEDIRRYGAWMREKALGHLGRLFPPKKIMPAMCKDRRELKAFEGREQPVVAYIWARTVASSNPAANGFHVPLVTTWYLSKKEGAEVWIDPIIGHSSYQLRIKTRASGHTPPSDADEGTKQGRGANFKCLLTGTPLSPDYIKGEGVAGRLGKRMLAVVIEGNSGRLYVEPNDEDESIAFSAKSSGAPAEELNSDPRNFWCPLYGLRRYCDLFTERQMAVMTTYASLVSEVQKRATGDAAALGQDAVPLAQGGKGAQAYGEQIAVYMSFLVAAASDDLTSLVTWRPTHGTGATRTTFARQGLPMTWDFAEVNPFASSAGDLRSAAKAVALAVERLPAMLGTALQANAGISRTDLDKTIVSTDPPYYDNIGYADLSDFFYVWHRRILRSIFPDLFSLILVPKSEELVASPYRHGGKEAAERFFLDGMTQAIGVIEKASHPAFPTTIYYAFKESEESSEGVASTGWETFLSAVLASGFAVTATWPVRTERAGKITSGTNILASSIVLACRPSDQKAAVIARRDFMRELERQLPTALSDMTSDTVASVAPVDLAQAAIGPGMAIFSKYKAVLEADGSPMSVHNALVHINKAIDDYFAQAEGDMDADTRFCIGWFQQYEFQEGPFGEADVLARAKGTAVDGVRDAGVIQAAKNKVRLLRVKEYPASWDPTKDSRVPIWEACHQMCRALGDGESEAGALLARMPEKQDDIRQLAYRLYTICERKGWAEDARAYNELVTSWPAIVEESLKVGHKGSQMSLI